MTKNLGLDTSSVTVLMEVQSFTLKPVTVIISGLDAIISNKHPLCCFSPCFSLQFPYFD